MIRKLTQLVFLDQLIEQTIAKNDPSSPKPYLNGVWDIYVSFLVCPHAYS